MNVLEHSDSTAFLARAEPWLLEAEAEHNLVLGLAASLRGHPLGDAFFATVEQHGRVVGCAFRTPPYKLGLTRLPAQALAPLVEAVHRRYPDLDRVLGPTDTAAGFAHAWGKRLGGTPRLDSAQLIYGLDGVIPPVQRVPGELRRAAPGDLPLIVQWIEAFGAESAHPALDPEGTAHARITAGDLVLWVVENSPRCMAACAARTPNGARIGYVYTPPAERGRGCASACVATFSQWLLDEGCTFCTLYTDAANRTSNAIYQRIGYELVAECADWHLGLRELS